MRDGVLVWECRECEQIKPFEDFPLSPTSKHRRRRQCKQCIRERERANWANTSHRPSRAYDYKRAERFKRKYGITVDEYDAMLVEQNGVCCICKCDGRAWYRANDRYPLVVDHDHGTRKVRGLLCHHCNTMLGAARDDIDCLLAAVAYIQKMRRVEVKQDEAASGESRNTDGDGEPDRTGT